VIFTVALSSLVYGLIESNQRSFTDSLVLGCLTAAGVLLVVFVVVERRSAHPMFDLKLFLLPTFSGGLTAAFGLSASIFAMLLYLVLYLQDILGYSALGTGVRLMVISGAVLVVGMVSGGFPRGCRAVRPGPQIAAAVQSGQIGQVITRLPAPARPSAVVITRTAFTTGLNLILLVAAIIALVSGAVSRPPSAAGTSRSSKAR
jgi:hypothetical protein